MEKLKEPELMDLIRVHVVFAAIAAVTLLVPGLAVGLKMLVVVITYNILVPVVGHIRGHKNWLGIWFFAFILSLFQLFPDWFLSAELGVLVFPDDGFIMIGTVSAYMTGLWAIPFFIILFISEQTKTMEYNMRFLVIALVSLIIFVGAEATLWMLPSWYAQNVTMIGPVAVYIIVPEIVLGLSTMVAYDSVKNRHFLSQVLGAFFVMTLYLGNAVFSYFLLERVLLGV